MSFRHGIRSKIRLGNQGESPNERRVEDEKRMRKERTTQRLKGARLALPFPDHRLHGPSFSEDQQMRETIIIREIHTVLKDSPRFFIHYSEEDFTRKINKRVSEYQYNAFERPEECVEFCERRRFLFEQRPEDKHHRNTGFEHRKIVGEFVRFVQKNTSSTTRCRLQDLVELAKKKGWPKPSSEYSPTFSIEGEVRKLVVDSYPELFSIEREVFVGLQQLAYEIPSLWSEDILPGKSTKPSYSDKSRTEVFLAEITWSCYGYKGKVMKARVFDGFYEGCLVDFFEKYPTDLSNVTKIIPKDSYAIVYAYRVGCDSCKFFGVRAVPVAREVLERNLDYRRKLELIARGDLDEVQVSAHRSTSYHRVEYAPLNDLITAEKSLIKFVDQLFPGELLTKDRFLEILQKRSEVDSEHYFRDPQAALEFLRDRPYLYFFNGHEARVICPVDRRAYNALFKFWNNNANKGKTIQEISKGMEDVGCQTPVESLIETLIKAKAVTKDLRWNGSSRRQGESWIYSPKVYYDKMQQTLLPGHPIDEPRQRTPYSAFPIAPNYLPFSPRYLD